jgi:hypothetical protein
MKTRLKKNQRNQRKTRKIITKDLKLKQMNCSPMVLGETVHEKSCFTKPVLLKLKDSYNMHHTENPIQSTNPTKIWIELKDRLSRCSKEDCWLNVIDDSNQRKQLDEYIFAPDHPSEWNMDPNSWLSNLDIISVLKQYESKYPNFHLIGPTPIDFDKQIPSENGQCVWQELCDFSLDYFLKMGKTKLGVVFNLSPSDKAGSHWVSLFIDLEDNFLFYFDSGGSPLPREVMVLINRIILQGREYNREFVLYNNIGIQHQYGNTECGMYSLFFTITMLTNKVFVPLCHSSQKKKTLQRRMTHDDDDDEYYGSLNEKKCYKIFSNYKKRIDFFRKKRIADKYVEQFRKIYFNK